MISDSEKNTLITDGAMGTYHAQLTGDDYGFVNWRISLTRLDPAMGSGERPKKAELN